MSGRKASVAAVALVTLCAAPALAQHTISIDIENDVFTGTDRHYTNGLRIGWLSPDRNAEWIDRAFDRWQMPAPPGRKRLSLSLGQNMYTPEDITRPRPDDRPYGGILYVGFGVIADTGTRYDLLELDLGIVGPASLAAPTQSWFHQLIDSPIPKGWQSQIGNEPAVNLSWERKWRNLDRLPHGFAIDFTPHLSVSLGNVFTYAGAGGMLRFGHNVPDNDYGPPRIRPSAPGSAMFEPNGTFGWYVFAGGEARAVARNIFLDGNTFGDSLSVDKRPFVADFQAGVSFNVWRYARLAYTYVLRSKEFDGQTSADRFAAISLSMNF
ncbi:MAG: lipid A deacylase LpxR family protein [Rhodospirillales bacterium]|nr:lipid A deacylase LpxR family protein [Rhodospirillales bacterium]